MQPGFPDLGQLMARAQQLQADVERAQQSLAASEVTGSAGGGLVVAVMTGDGTLQSLRIDPGVVDPTDVETLADLVVAAVRDAQREVAELGRDTMGAATGGLADAFSGMGFGPPVIDADAGPKD